MIYIKKNPAIIHTFNKAIVEHAAREVLDYESVSSVTSLTIVFTDDAQMHELNSEYLKIKAPTDVLSFPANELDPETDSTYLGDILISLPRAIEQSNAAGHPLEAEIQLLVVHGVLHLLGYDHVNPKEKRRMWDTQVTILEQLGLEGMNV
jgi:probable rRNA maturation factor